MRVAVTGAAGFIGSHLCERLVHDGHEAIGIDNFDDFYAAAVKRANLGALTRAAGFKLCEADIRDRIAIERALAGADAVIHLAARAGVRPSFALTSLYADVNVTGTAVILEAMSKLQVPHLIFGSSSSVYGRGAETPFREAGGLGEPASPYASTKVAGEMLCRNYSTRIERTTVLRFFTVYGPRQRPDLAIHKFARLILAERPIPVFGSLDSFRDYTFIDDIVEGVVTALRVEEAYATFNLGSGDPITLGAMIEHLEKALGRSATRDMLPAQEGDLYGTWADVGAARSALGYEPRWNFEEGSQRFADWMLASSSAVGGGLT
ncbi:MAG: NAD-dependent epimerase/dehydratase family protein [Actinomycetota bacterium]